MDKKTHYIRKLKTPVGPITLVANDKALVALTFGDWLPDGIDRVVNGDANPILAKAEVQLDEYFCGERTYFDIPLSPHGTEFQRTVWSQLAKIPYGETITYGEQARRMGKPQASRAVGAANGKNPISIIVPCHRVIGASGSLTGFGGGLENKRKLLVLEGVLLA